MICPPCAAAADMGNKEHGEAECAWPSSCTCQHGFPLEMDDVVGEGHFNGYLDGLPADDPRRIAYEQRVGRRINN